LEEEQQQAEEEEEEEEEEDQDRSLYMALFCSLLPAYLAVFRSSAEQT
jgi:hypothetical protein